MSFVPPGASKSDLAEALANWQRAYTTDLEPLVSALNDIAMGDCDDPQKRAREALDELMKPGHVRDRREKREHGLIRRLLG